MSTAPRRARIWTVILTSGFLAAAAIAPQAASAGGLSDLLTSLGIGGKQASGPQKRAGLPGVGSGYQPPAHGTAPHGQGTVGVVDLVPEDTVPLSDDPAGGSGSGEDVVVGRPVGSQNGDGSYSGHITIVGLLGSELLGVHTDEGETAAGPLDPVQTALLDSICTGSGNQLCLEVLAADSSTSSSGSTNGFAVARATLGSGGQSISAGAAESNGSISDDGTCQTAEGDSSVATANVLGAVTADALQSESSSQACNDGSQSQSNDSEVVNLQGQGLGLPAAGCADGTPDTEFVDLALLIATVCNADDSNGVGEAATQAGAPYGVREALSVFLLPGLLGNFAKATTGASESRAAAPDDPNGPEGPEDPDGRGGDGPGGPGTPGDGGGPGGPGGRGTGTGTPGDGGGPGGPASGDTVPGPDSLPFTGANIALMLLMAFGLIGAGGSLVAVRAATRD